VQKSNPNICMLSEIFPRKSYTKLFHPESCERGFYNEICIILLRRVKKISWVSWLEI